MRILLFINDIHGGGAQLGLANAMSWGFLKNDDVTVLTLIKADGRAEAAFKKLPNVRVVTLFPQAKLSIAHLAWGFLLYPYWVFRTRPQAIFLSLAQANLIGRLWGHLFPITHVTIENSTRHRIRIFNKLLPLLSCPITLVLSDTQTTLDTMADSYPYRKNIRKLLLPLYRVLPSQFATPSQPAGPFHIMSAGRLMPVKNFAEAIKAVAMLVSQGHDIHYTIFGDGEQKAELQALIEHLNLTSRITLAGFNGAWQAELSRAHLYLQPSLYEGLCITVLEAMQAGIPVAASATGGLLDYGTPHVTYEPLLPPKADTIARTVKDLILQNAHRKTLAKNAQNALQTHFGPHAVEAQYAAIHTALESRL